MEKNRKLTFSFLIGLRICFSPQLKPVSQVPIAFSLLLLLTLFFFHISGQSEQHYHDVIPISCPASSDTPVNASTTTATAISSTRPTKFSAKLKCQVSWTVTSEGFQKHSTYLTLFPLKYINFNVNFVRVQGALCQIHSENPVYKKSIANLLLELQIAIATLTESVCLQADHASLSDSGRFVFILIFQLWPSSITQQLSPQSISTAIPEPSSCTNTSELQCPIPRSFKHSR